MNIIGIMKIKIYQSYTKKHFSYKFKEIEKVLADRVYTSSKKTCRQCRGIYKDLKLNYSVYKCGCG